MKKHHWHKAPPRGMSNALATIHRFTVVRLSDKAERFTDTLPASRIRKSPDFRVWDNQLNAEWVD